MSAPSAIKAFKALRREGKGISTSNGLMFNNTIFARDVAMVSTWLVQREPQIAREVILTLAGLQGFKIDGKSEQEPGKIHNEHRNLANWQAPDWLKRGAGLLSRIWGGDRNGYTVYFGADNTCWYLLLVDAFVKVHGPDIMDEVAANGRKVRWSVMLALEWLLDQIHDGLVLVPRHNKLGLFNQTWRDSHSAYVRSDGSLPNLRRPLAYLDMQWLAWEAIQAWQGRQVTNELLDPAATLERFWLPDVNYFSDALEEIDGIYRPLGTLSSAAGWLLQSRMLGQIKDEQWQSYAEGIVRRLFGRDFMTPAGVRTRSLRHLDGLADYHGCWSVWVVDNFMIARGLRQQGFPRLARQLENRILNACNVAGNFYEYFLVDQNNQVLYRPHEAKSKRGVAVQMVPEKDLAWSIAIGLILKRQSRDLSQPLPLTRELEDEILAGLDPVYRLKYQSELVTAYRPAPFGINQTKGLARSVGRILKQTPVWIPKRP